MFEDRLGDLLVTGTDSLEERFVNIGQIASVKKKLNHLKSENQKQDTFKDYDHYIIKE